MYPWGDEFDSSLCNTEESGLGGTTSVGVYPGGASSYGVMDMAGNVWEWCSSLFRDYPYDPDDGREDLEAEGPRVLRGGSWDYLSERRARCAYRYFGRPAYFVGSRGLRVVVGFAALSPSSGFL